MIGAVSQYTQSIAMIIIFTSFVNLIMPSGDFEKYIKMILGLIVIITILAPINIVIFKNKPDYTDILKRYETEIESTSMQMQSGQYFLAQKDIILDHYRGTLKPQMVEIIEKSNKVEVVDLEIGLDEDIDSKEFGKITTINMVVTQVQEKVSEKRIQVPKIKVGTKKIKSYSGDQIEGQIQEKIKKSIIDFYNLPHVNINIIVQKNS